MTMDRTDGAPPLSTLQCRVIDPTCRLAIVSLRDENGGDATSDVDGADVPSPIDFHDPAQARAWLEDTQLRKPFRPQFFAAFCEALAAIARPRILELGSGPGHLARELVSRCAPRDYVALDFSPAMHDLARAHLGELAACITFETRDFRDPAWPTGLGTFDAVVTMQAVHETRHKRHALPLFERARSVLARGGLLLYCDGYLTPASKKPALLLDRAEQPLALERAGFTNVTVLRDEHALALYAATA
jgi:SAM-dependent methyltransferase